jgi:hypothetical protein
VPHAWAGRLRELRRLVIENRPAGRRRSTRGPDTARRQPPQRRRTLPASCLEQPRTRRLRDVRFGSRLRVFSRLSEQRDVVLLDGRSARGSRSAGSSVPAASTTSGRSGLTSHSDHRFSRSPLRSFELLDHVPVGGRASSRESDPPAERLDDRCALWQGGASRGDGGGGTDAQRSVDHRALGEDATWFATSSDGPSSNMINTRERASPGSLARQASAAVWRSSIRNVILPAEQ